MIFAPRAAGSIILVSTTRRIARRSRRCSGNWGNRPDLANMPPNQIHLYKPHGTGVGLGDPLPGSGARVLEKDS